MKLFFFIGLVFMILQAVEAGECDHYWKEEASFLEDEFPEECRDKPGVISLKMRLGSRRLNGIESSPGKETLLTRYEMAQKLMNAFCVSIQEAHAQTETEKWAKSEINQLHGMCGQDVNAAVGGVFSLPVEHSKKLLLIGATFLSELNKRILYPILEEKDFRLLSIYPKAIVDSRGDGAAAVGHGR